VARAFFDAERRDAEEFEDGSQSTHPALRALICCLYFKSSASLRPCARFFSQSQNRKHSVGARWTEASVSCVSRPRFPSDWVAIRARTISG